MLYVAIVSRQVVDDRNVMRRRPLQSRMRVLRNRSLERDEPLVGRLAKVRFRQCCSLTRSPRLPLLLLSGLCNAFACAKLVVALARP